LHWVLDVTFREDDSRVRDQRAARNLAVLRKIAINLVGRDGSTKASVRARRKKAAWNDRGGSGNLHRCDEWSFCLTAARMAAEQERR
jgi:hypothetical protein